MAQYKIGTVTVTNSSTAVVGVGTEFLANVIIGDIFVRVGDSLTYEVGSIIDDLNLVLSAPYLGVTGAGALYTINRDFTSPDNIPLLSQGDIETARIFTRAMNKIQNLITTGITQQSDTIIPLIQDAQAGLVVYDGLIPSRAIQINAISLFAEIIPTGANIIMRLLKDGAEVAGADAILTATTSHEKTILAPAIAYTTSERLGLKFIQAGSGDPGSGIIVTLHIQ